MNALSRAASPADPAKVLHVAFKGADDGFDPAKSSNGFTQWVSEVLYEPLLTYEYLARPAKLVPLTVQTMPEVTADRLTYAFHLKPGIRFTPDAVFKGKPRILMAADYVYTFERLMDPATRSPMAGFLSGKIAGLDAWVAQAQKTGRADYAAPIAGLSAPDASTLKITLTKPDPEFLYLLAMPATGAVAQEAIAAYGQNTARHPVGTGPYQLSGYTPGSKIELTANPVYRGFVWDFKAGNDPEDKLLVRQMGGKRMPRIGKVDIGILEEDQSRWLAFAGGQLDADEVPMTLLPQVLDGDRLKSTYVDEGIRLERVVIPEITYTVFNMRDPVVGGLSDAKIALRRAIAMSFDEAAEIDQVYHGQAVRSEGIVPLGVVGFDPKYRSSLGYDRVLVNLLLDHFGYKRGADGWRTLPDGQPLSVRITEQIDAPSRIRAEIWKRGLDAISIRSIFDFSTLQNNLRAGSQCRLTMSDTSWQADYPNGGDFTQLLYGPNIHRGNHACYESAAYDALYRQAQDTTDADKRMKLFDDMSRQMEADTPWLLHVARVRNWLVRPWVLGFKHHPILNANWPYLDIDTKY